MTELAFDPATHGYVVFWLGEVCEWDPKDGRLYAQEGRITLFADQLAAGVATQKTILSIRRINRNYVAKQGDWRISPVRRVRAKEPPPAPASPKGAVP